MLWGPRLEGHRWSMQRCVPASRVPQPVSMNFWAGHPQPHRVFELHAEFEVALPCACLLEAKLSFSARICRVHEARPVKTVSGE